MSNQKCHTIVNVKMVPSWTKTVFRRTPIVAEFGRYTRTRNRVRVWRHVRDFYFIHVCGFTKSFSEPVSESEVLILSLSESVSYSEVIETRLSVSKSLSKSVPEVYKFLCPSLPRRRTRNMRNPGQQFGKKLSLSGTPIEGRFYNLMRYDYLCV